jgi:hypothetical protein
MTTKSFQEKFPAQLSSSTPAHPIICPAPRRIGDLPRTRACTPNQSMPLTTAVTTYPPSPAQLSIDERTRFCLSCECSYISHMQLESFIPSESGHMNRQQQHGSIRDSPGVHIHKQLASQANRPASSLGHAPPTNNANQVFSENNLRKGQQS